MAGSIIRYSEQIQANPRSLDHGANVGSINGNTLLHATSTGGGEGNCSILCEFDPAGSRIRVHAIGAHRREGYKYDGVSSGLDTVLENNMGSHQNVCRYTDGSHDSVSMS